MGEEELTKVEASADATVAAPPPSEAAPALPPPSDALTAEEKVVALTSPTEEKADDTKALVPVEKVDDPPSPEKTVATATDRDMVLARVATDKKASLIKAWEESEKAKAENKAHRKMSTITAWENSKKAAIEAELRKIEEALEKKKAEYGEKMKNKIAMIHKEAEEKRAMVESKRGEELLKAEESGAKFRALGHVPKTGCFGS